MRYCFYANIDNREHLIRKIKNAEVEFDDVNCERTLEALERLKREINDFSNKMKLCCRNDLL